MSTERSSSAVRSLRSIFENKETEAQNAEARQQSRSPAGGREERNRPLSKVRSNFVAVVPSSMSTATAAEHTPETDGGELERVSSASRRRQSFSENDENKAELEALKRSVTQESERRGREPSVQETIPEVAVESAAATPLLELKESQALGAIPQTTSKLNEMSLADEPQPPANPEKPITGAEEEPGALKPADLTSAAAISTAAVSSEPRDKSTKKTLPKPLSTSTNGKSSRPSTLLSKTNGPPTVQSPKSPASVKSTATSLAQSAKSAVKDLSRKVSRSSLTAPTAASSARGTDKRESLASKSSASKPRESTKPANVSAHLLAPTAASKARAPENSKPAVTAASKPSARPTPRTSLASRPDSRTSQGTKKATVVDGSFLDRMTRPTAASQSRAHEKKPEIKAPQKRAAPVKRTAASQTNGSAKHETLAEEQSETIAPSKENDDPFVTEPAPAVPESETAIPEAVAADEKTA